MLRKVIWSTALLCACSGSQSKTETAASASEPAPEETQVERIAIGECAETPVGQEGKKISSVGAGWSYLAPKETQVQCADYKVVLAVGAGLNMVITSYRPLEDGLSPAKMTEMMVRTAAENVLTMDPKAEIADIETGTYGEAQHPGHCGSVSFTTEGHDLRSIVCSVSAASGGGVEHIFLAAITDTEEGFQKTGLTDTELFSRLVDNWSPTP